MMPAKAVWAEDEGFSIIELIIAATIGVMVLVAAYMLFETGMKGYRQVEYTTVADRNAAQAMSLVDRPIRELQQMTRAGDYEMQFMADTNDDEGLERVRIYLPAGTTTLLMDKASSSGADTVTTTIADKIRNRTTGEPVFSYFRSVGSPPMSNETSRVMFARVVRIAVVTWADSTPTPPPYRVNTEVFLRNRGQ